LFALSLRGNLFEPDWGTIGGADLMTHRTAARVVGVLFIMATVPFSLSVVLLEPVVGAPDFLAQASLSKARIAGGVLLELVNHIAVVGIAVVIYPVLKPFSERLALGYVAVRSIEAVLFAVGTLHLLTLEFVGHEFVAAGAPPSSYFHTVGSVLLAGHDWDNAALAFTAFSVGALMLNYLLYWAKLVPRWISAWGFLAAGSILAARVMVISGLELSTATVTMLDAPIFLQEMVFAVWLIVRGFDASALTARPRGPEPSAE
jgi:hypothetical protein